MPLRSLPNVSCFRALSAIVRSYRSWISDPIDGSSDSEFGSEFWSDVKSERCNCEVRLSASEYWSEVGSNVKSERCKFEARLLGVEAAL